MTQTLSELSTGALRDLANVFAWLKDEAADDLIDAIMAANRIALYGVGREGLQMKGFAMRLFHLGFDAHVVGDMTMPPIGPGDLLIVSAGPGDFSTVDALMRVAHEAGASSLVVTAQPQGDAAKRATLVTHIPAQTMADDQGPNQHSVLPMGSLFETAQMIFFELVVLKLRDLKGETAQTMRARHTNME
ncbi:MAG: SIS domain-containing protein [Geminicoccaceae bacterium]